MRKKLLFVLSSVLVSAHVHADFNLKPGRWVSVSKSTINNVDVNEVHKQIMEQTRSQLPADQRAQYDREMSSERERLTTGRSYECLKPREKEITSRQMMEKTQRSFQDEKSICVYSDEHADDHGFGFTYHCKTAAGARNEGVMKFTAFSDTSYRFESTGSGQTTNGAGEPLSGMMPAHGVMDSKWIAAQCQPHDETDDDDAAEEK